MNKIIEIAGRLAISSIILSLTMAQNNAVIDWVIWTVIFLILTAWTFNHDVLVSGEEQ